MLDSAAKVFLFFEKRAVLEWQLPVPIVPLSVHFCTPICIGKIGAYLFSVNIDEPVY